MTRQRSLEIAGSLRRKDFFQVAAAYTPYVVAEIEGLQFLISTTDRHWNKLFWNRIKERDVLDRALHAIEATGRRLTETTFVDVGASIGTTTLLALRAGFGSVLAVEPEPHNFRLLNANVILNEQTSRVLLRRVALSDRRGEGLIAVVAEKSGAAYLVENGDEADWPTEPVPVTTLDELVADEAMDPTTIGLLWLDCEGAEGRVLAGATRTLEHRVPVVLELNPDTLRRTDGADDLVELLRHRFTHVLDLRDEAAELQPIERTAELAHRCAVQGKATDVLALNLD